MTGVKEPTEELRLGELLEQDLYQYSAISFTFFTDGTAMPYIYDKTLTMQEWRTLSNMVERFYASLSPDWIGYMKWTVNNRPLPKTKKKHSKPGFVYVLNAGPYYKIGRTKNVDRRIKQLAALPPFDIELIHTIKADDMCLLELALHERFAEKRKNGEWFELDEEDVAWLKTL